MPETAFIYAIVRRDLSEAQRLVQILHAGHEAGRVVGRQDTYKDKPALEPAHVCLFEVANEHELIRAARFLDRANVKHELFYEEDNDAGYTALVTEPLRGPRRDPLINSGFTLYGTQDGANS